MNTTHAIRHALPQTRSRPVSADEAAAVEARILEGLDWRLGPFFEAAAEPQSGLQSGAETADALPRDPEALAELLRGAGLSIDSGGACGYSGAMGGFF